MGLLDKFSADGSSFTQWDGFTPNINPLGTKSSEMHYEYSINGQDFTTVNSQYQKYVDGVTNILPRPSQLDLDGLTPSKYTDNLPE